MAQLSVRELGKDSRDTEKKIQKYFILKPSCNFEKPAALNWKRFANRALLTIAATLLNDTDVKHLGNHTDSVTIYLRERSRERSYEMRFWCRSLPIFSIPNKYHSFVMLNITVTTDQALSQPIHARGHEWCSYIIWMCLWRLSLPIFSIHNKYRKWQCSISW